MTRNIIAAMLDDGSTQVVIDRVLPGSEIVEEVETVELQDRTEAMLDVRRRLTIRAALDIAQRDQIAAWVRDRTPVTIVAETLTDVLYWQDRTLQLAMGGSENGLAVMRITTADADIY